MVYFNEIFIKNCIDKYIGVHSCKTSMADAKNVDNGYFELEDYFLLFALCA
jgi:hypothetical protein